MKIGDVRYVWIPKGTKSDAEGDYIQRSGFPPHLIFQERKTGLAPYSATVECDHRGKWFKLEKGVTGKDFWMGESSIRWVDPIAQTAIRIAGSGAGSSTGYVGGRTVDFYFHAYVSSAVYDLTNPKIFVIPAYSDGTGRVKDAHSPSLSYSAWLQLLRVSDLFLLCALQTKLMTQQSVELKSSKDSVVHWHALSPMECTYAGLHVVYAVEYDKSKYLGLHSTRTLDVVTTLLHVQQPHAVSVAHYFRIGLSGCLKTDETQRVRIGALVRSILAQSFLPELSVFTLINFLDKAGIAQQNEITNGCTHSVLNRAYPPQLCANRALQTGAGSDAVHSMITDANHPPTTEQMTDLLQLLGAKRAHSREYLSWTSVLLTVVPPAGTMPEAAINGITYLANMGGVVRRGGEEMRTGAAGEITWAACILWGLRPTNLRPPSPHAQRRPSTPIDGRYFLMAVRESMHIVPPPLLVI